MTGIKENNGRLLSLDVLRGFDMSFIMGGEVVLICFSKPVNTLFGGVLKSLPEDYYVLGWWCCYMLVCWCLLYFLYRKKVFLKV